MPWVVLDWKKLFKTILEMVFFFSLSIFPFVWVLCPKIRKNGLLRGEFFFLEIVQFWVLKNQEYYVYSNNLPK
jgi:hypothetical protein